ncbi:hypothetical protein BHM03_00055710 [Ensete ventricosum]|nr:hypothetical protein BHM03_00055710 [Ensete ventricosum]
MASRCDGVFAIVILVVIVFSGNIETCFAARHLLDTAEPAAAPPAIPAMPKLTLPPMPAIPNLMVPPLPVVPTIPTLAAPPLPAFPTVPTVTLPPMPSIPTIPAIPFLTPPPPSAPLTNIARYPVPLLSCCSSCFHVRRCRRPISCGDGFAATARGVHRLWSVIKPHFYRALPFLVSPALASFLPKHDPLYSARLDRNPPLRFSRNHLLV